MKSMRRPLTAGRIERNDRADFMAVNGRLPRLVFERLEDASQFLGVPKSVLIGRAIGKYLQEMEERRLDNPCASSPAIHEQPFHQRQARTSQEPALPGLAG
jgi:predicted DNA-binding protein